MRASISLHDLRPSPRIVGPLASFDMNRACTKKAAAIFVAYGPHLSDKKVLACDIARRLEKDGAGVVWCDGHGDDDILLSAGDGRHVFVIEAATSCEVEDPGVFDDPSVRLLFINGRFFQVGIVLTMLQPPPAVQPVISSNIDYVFAFGTSCEETRARLFRSHFHEGFETLDSFCAAMDGVPARGCLVLDNTTHRPQDLVAVYIPPPPQPPIPPPSPPPKKKH